MRLLILDLFLFALVAGASFGVVSYASDAIWPTAGCRCGPGCKCGPDCDCNEAKAEKQEARLRIFHGRRTPVRNGINRVRARVAGGGLKGSVPC